MQSILKTCLFLSLTTLSMAAQPTPQAPVNPLARFGTSDPTNLFLTGELIYFKPLNPSALTVYVNDQGDAPEIDISQGRNFTHKFTPAFRVALGYNTDYNGWDTVLSYTAMRYKHTRNFPIYSNVQGLIHNTTTSQTYKYDLDLGELDLGRMFQASSKLKLRPHIGVRGLYLSQIFFSHATLDSETTFYKIGSTLIGLEGGLESIWMFSRGFSAYANIALASLVNAQNERSRVLTATDQDYQRYDTGTHITSELDFFIGLRWDRNFSQDAYHLGITLGYEQHDFINLNYVAGLSELTPFQYPNFDLQGISFGARFDF